MKEKPGKVILIAEDEGLIALEMMEFLEREGYRVPAPVPSGEEAVAWCRANPSPDLILMDVTLAGKIDGIEAARRIREHHWVPVIILTARDDDRTVRRIRELAPQGYLVKPASRGELLACISLILGSCGRQGSGKAGAGAYGDSRGQTGQ
ncbi:MAG TPA: response regulator [Methanoregula sp.]|nr:response regulator [Methanoregula sp.]